MGRRQKQKITKTKTKVTVQNQKHVPVLIREVLEYLAPQKGESYLDATAGYGGHARAILEASQGNATLIDRDTFAINELHKRFNTNDTEIIHSDFLSASKQLAVAGNQYDMILADLGVSSPHLNISSRGFSFNSDAPLDMRMDQDQTLTAAEIVNTFPAKALVHIFQDYGDEPKAQRIARSIVEARPITSTSQLAAIAAKAWPGHSRVHPATRIFQALRIAVNDELRQLEETLPIWIELLQPGGRLVVISFHSLEDRIVKRIFQQMGQPGFDAKLVILTKRPITASPKELVSNPRARSARLRAAAKIKKREGK